MKKDHQGRWLCMHCQHVLEADRSCRHCKGHHAAGLGMLAHAETLYALGDAGNSAGQCALLDKVKADRVCQGCGHFVCSCDGAPIQAPAKAKRTDVDRFCEWMSQRTANIRRMHGVYYGEIVVTDSGDEAGECIGSVTMPNGDTLSVWRADE